MATKDKRIDAYIAKSADFAKPILKHFRDLVHKGCPEVEETMKWSFPHFDYKGSMMCSMASFKNHCAISFWKASLMSDSKALIQKAKSEEAMGHLGRITSLMDLPKDATLVKYIKEAKKLNDEGIKLAQKPKSVIKEVGVPDYFMNAVKKNKKALKTFEGFSNSKKKEYVMWVTEAKTEETRMSRLKTSVEWISEGKARNWKYEK
ncbi:MAG: YdeI/OmpD-associated family protein [Bacteroidia bacterium]